MYSYPNLIPLPRANRCRRSCARSSRTTSTDLRRLVGDADRRRREGDRRALGRALRGRAARRAAVGLQPGAGEALGDRAQAVERLGAEHEPYVPVGHLAAPAESSAWRRWRHPRAAAWTAPAASCRARSCRSAATTRRPGCTTGQPDSASRITSRRAEARRRSRATWPWSPRSTAVAAQRDDRDRHRRVVDVRPAGVLDDLGGARDPADAPADHPVLLRERADDHRALGHAVGFVTGCTSGRSSNSRRSMAAS